MCDLSLVKGVSAHLLSDNQSKSAVAMSTNAAEQTAADAGAPGRELFATMALVRAFETSVAELYRDGAIPGFVHTSLGQEAVAAGVCAALEPDDYLATTHRGHGHCLAKGVDVDGMMAELFARAEGLCRGKGGSMHVADPGLGVLGANAIVGASLPLAVGAGLSSKLRRQGRVAVAFFGEGAVNQGAFHEAVNLAAIWDLPVLLVCENNVYAEFTDSRRMTRVPSVAARSAAYGVDAEVVDGNDAEAAHAAASTAVARCRDGRGPVLLEAETYRWHGHYEGDAQPYKPEEEVSSWRERDPLVVSARRLVERGDATEEELDAIQAQARERVDAAVERARALPVPDPEEAFHHVFGD
jgi:TPP-dependent pyruvate/acetoin dehydrogenase alpha subunit